MDITKLVVWLLFFISVILCGFNSIFFTVFIFPSLIILCMAFLLAMIQLHHDYFVVNDRYRYVGDAIFFIPIFYLLLS